jgi:hypothetical protein
VNDVTGKALGEQDVATAAKDCDAASGSIGGGNRLN